MLPHSNQLANDINSDDGDSITSVRGYWSVQPRVAATAEDEAAGGNDILYIDYADVAGNLGTIKRWHLDDNGNLVTAIRASSGSYDGEVQVPDDNGEPQSRYVWRLNNMTELSIAQGFDSTQVQSASDTLVLPFAPKSVSLLTRDAENLSLTELYAHRQLMAEQNKRSLSHELAFWQKLLSPLSILSLVVVACSFVFGSLRTHSLGLRIVVALLFGLLFSYLQDLVGFISLATGWSPMLMVLLPIIASAGLGLYFIKRQM